MGIGWIEYGEKNNPAIKDVLWAHQMWYLLIGCGHRAWESEFWKNAPGNPTLPKAHSWDWHPEQGGPWVLLLLRLQHQSTWETMSLEENKWLQKDVFLVSYNQQSFRLQMLKPVPAISWLLLTHCWLWATWLPRCPHRHQPGHILWVSPGIPNPPLPHCCLGQSF